MRRRAAVENLLLAALPRAERGALLARSERVELVAGNSLNEPEERIRYVIFPAGSFVALITPMERRAQLEVALVGNEGMLGVSLILGVRTSPVLALVVGGGPAWRMDAATFSDALKRCPALARCLQRYLYVLVNLMARTAACGHFHPVEARLARWLLMMRDRAQSNRVRITHEVLAHVLGVRREGVTQAASALRRRRIIRYSRGDVEILDLARLEAVACTCYANAKEVYARVLVS